MVPTAADIAYGLRFVSDLVVDGLIVTPAPAALYKGVAGPDVANACLFRKMLSLRLRAYKTLTSSKKMTRCFATDTLLHPGRLVNSAPISSF
jgi:hypothetical protein